MFVEELLPEARERLVTIADDALLIEAAKLLQAETELVIVCNSEGVLIGVITKTDIVKQISYCQGASCMTQAAAVMTRDVLLCEARDLLHDVWTRMDISAVSHAHHVIPQRSFVPLRLTQQHSQDVTRVEKPQRPGGWVNDRDILQTSFFQCQRASPNTAIRENDAL